MKEKKKQGGGRGPVVGGEDHSPADSKVQFDNQIKFVYIYISSHVDLENSRYCWCMHHVQAAYRPQPE